MSLCPKGLSLGPGLSMLKKNPIPNHVSEKKKTGLYKIPRCFFSFSNFVTGYFTAFAFLNRAVEAKPPGFKLKEQWQSPLSLWGRCYTATQTSIWKQRRILQPEQQWPALAGSLCHTFRSPAENTLDDIIRIHQWPHRIRDMNELPCHP